MQAQSTTQFVIQYRYPGTTNGRPVGDVYVTGPHFGADIWSHTYKVADAAKLSEREALRIQHKWAHNLGRLVPVTEAVDLDG